MKRFWGTSILMLVAAFTSAQSVPVLEGKTDIYAVMPSRLMFTGVPLANAISPNGRYIGWMVGDGSISDLLPSIEAIVNPPVSAVVPPQRLMVYDRERHVAEDRGSLGAGCLTQIDALGNDGTFLVTVLSAPSTAERRGQLVLSKPFDHSLSRTVPYRPSDLLTVDPPAGYFMVQPESRVDSKGGSIPRTEPVVVFDSQGKVVFKQVIDGFLYLDRGHLLLPSKARGKRTAINLATGEQSVWNSREDSQTPSPAVEWDQRPEQHDPYVAPSLKATVRGTSKPVALAGGFQNLFVDPQNRFMVYSDGDAMLIRDIVAIDPAKWAEMKRANEKRVLVNRAKQVGMALLMYSSDYDDVYPPSGNFDDRVLPYLRSRDIMKDFVYLTPSLRPSTLENVATTVIGFLQGQGGMAVVYADGHAKWVAGK